MAFTGAKREKGVAMRIEEILVKKGAVDEETVARALEAQRAGQETVGEALLRMGAVSEAELNEALVLEASLKAEPLENIRDFLASVIPFNGLSDEDLERVSNEMEWLSFPPGRTIIKQGTQGNLFFLVKSGLVKVLLDQDNIEVVLGFLGEGDCFGEMSLLTGAPTSATVVTVEQTRCLVHKRDDFLTVVSKYPAFHTFFNQLLTQRMKTVYKELLSTTPGISQVEPFLYRKRVRDLMSPGQAFFEAATPIRSAAQSLLEGQAGAAIVTGPGNRAEGVVDLARVVTATLFEGRDPAEPVSAAMSTSFHTIDADSYFFDALHQMVRKQASRLVVTEKGEAVGVLSGLDLLRFRGREVLSLVRNIEEAPTTTELDRMRREVEKVLRALIADGAIASAACKIVSELNDKIVVRAIRLAEEMLGSPPAPFVWLGLGSEGRKEQTLLTDQDNGLLFAGPPSRETTDYFGMLAREIVEGLNTCGFPLCKGNIMATNPKYFGSLGEWQERSRQWIAGSPDAKELVDIYVFLDFRGVYGDPSLEKELKSSVIRFVQESPDFARIMAEPIVNVPMPLGFFKHLVVEKNGKYKNTVALKTHGLLPLTACTKIVALTKGIHATNTLERLRALKDAAVMTTDQVEFFEQALETFLTLKIRNDLNDMDQGRDFSNHVDPSTLGMKQKQLLKEAFLAVSEMQKLTRDYLRIGTGRF
jgi:CBS domain-containing protein